MTLRSRVVVAVIATAVVLVFGGVGTGLSMARQQRAANRQTPVARPIATVTPEPVVKHSLVGRVVSVESDRVLVRDRERRLREVRLAHNTVVRKSGKRVERGVLAAGDRVAVVGRPGPDRALVARLIAVTPTPRR